MLQVVHVAEVFGSELNPLLEIRVFLCVTSPRFALSEYFCQELFSFVNFLLPECGLEISKKLLCEFPLGSVNNALLPVCQRLGRLTL